MYEDFLYGEKSLLSPDEMRGLVFHSQLSEEDLFKQLEKWLNEFSTFIENARLEKEPEGSSYIRYLMKQLECLMQPFGFNCAA